MNRENNTGVLPPEGEESAEFENVNAEVNANAGATENSDVAPGGEEEAASNSNSPLQNNAVEVPETAVTEEVPEPNVTTTTKPKRTQSAAQQKTMASQAEERASLKSAGVAKPSVAMVATLASMRTKGNPSYNSAFANAVAGKPLNSYRAAKTARVPRKKANTVINTTVRNTNRGANGSVATNFMMPSAAANSRNNNGAAKETIGAIQSMGESAISTVREMMRLSTTLTKELAKTNNTAGLAAASEWKSNLAPLSSLRNESRRKPKKERKPRVRRSKKNASNSLLGLPPLPTALETIPEGENNNNAFTPPP